MLVLSNRGEGLQVAEFPAAFSEPLALGKITGDIPAGQWVQVRIPLYGFSYRVDLRVSPGVFAEHYFSSRDTPTERATL